jgi:hypothetical protein
LENISTTSFTREHAELLKELIELGRLVFRAPPSVVISHPVTTECRAGTAASQRVAFEILTG